jgi:heavy metal sensor kinase
MGVFRQPLRFRHTLSFRLTLWYGGIFTFSSFVAFLLFYLLITAVIRERTDQDLSEQVEKFARLLSTGGIEAIKRVAIVEAQAAGERKIFFRLLSRRGEVFLSSNMSYWRDIGVERNAISRVLARPGLLFETITIPGRKQQVRIVYGMIGPGVILQLGQSMENYTRFIEAFKKIFVATMAFLVLLAVLIGWFMARQALAGLGEVTRTAQRISAGGTLQERVPVKPTGDEIDRLAMMFNQMLNRIEALMRGIKEMSDNIAHDLKSPVTRIRGLAEITLTTETALDDYKNMAANTVEECDRLLDMINVMLVISRAEAGVERLHYEELDMAEVVRDACALFQPLAEDRGIAMTCEAPLRCPLRGDVRMIQRMVANLLDNAIKYTESEGKVHVQLRKDQTGMVTLTVKDTGMGIPAKDLEHIFERFYRADPSRSQTGTGLGLSLVKAVVTAHGGHIVVDSAVDRGSTFTVSLPYASNKEADN